MAKTAKKTKITKRKPAPIAKKTKITKRKPAPIAKKTKITKRKPAPIAKKTKITKRKPAPIAKKTKITKRKPAPIAKKTKITKRKPAPSATLKKITTVSDSNRALQKEIKGISKIFGENQKVLISLKEMIDTLTSTLETIQKQSRQLNIIEGDTQKLYVGLNQLRTQSGMVDKINAQTAQLQKEVNKISKSKILSRQTEDSIHSVKNNSQMMTKIVQRIDEAREDIRTISEKTDLLAGIGSEMDKLKDSIDEISKSTKSKSTPALKSLKQELEKIAMVSSSALNLDADLDTIKTTINTISSEASKIDSLAVVIGGLKEQLDDIKANSAERAGLESVRELGEKISKIEEQILSLSDIIQRQDTHAIQSRKESERLFAEIQSLHVADNSSKEMMALLKLSEYQSGIRMNAESKYGGLEDLETMASHTVEITGLFDRISAEPGQNKTLPLKVRQWAVGKILECADKWEIRFTDVYLVLTGAIGKDMFKESVKIQQVRDIYGIRAVDEIKNDLNIP